MHCVSPCLNVRGVWTVVGVVGTVWGMAPENVPYFQITMSTVGVDHDSNVHFRSLDPHLMSATTRSHEVVTQSKW